MLSGSDEEGAAWLFAGDATKGTFGGGFAYTNKSSISIGLVAGIEATMNHGRAPVYQMLEDFKQHPAIAPLIAGGKVVEHSGHMVPEGGLSIMPPLVGDGVLLAGESAMMCINLGYQVRGMDFAIAAGMHAGREAARALSAGDTSAQGLQGYTAGPRELLRHAGLAPVLEGAFFHGRLPSHVRWVSAGDSRHYEHHVRG